jgi:membrane protein DedA with SNARE-associated domain
MKDKYLQRSKLVFYVLLGVFVVLIGYFAVPFPAEVKRMLFPVAAVLALVFFVLGAVLLFFAWKSKAKKWLKISLMLTGGAAVGFLLGALLHNLVYGLLIYLFGEGVWDVFGGDEPFFFIFALIICPIVFLIGAIGGVVELIRRR